MEFQKRLERAIQRGQQAGDARARAEAEAALTERELARMHTQYRLELSERIDRCLRQVAEHFPGFRFETIVDERGWGAAIGRDDLNLPRGSVPASHFSRLEVVIRPYSSAHVIEIAAKGTVYNREVFHRTHYQPLGDADLTSFAEMVDLWVLEYAEAYAKRR